MATKAEIAAAYDMVKAAEKKLVDDLTAFAKTTMDGLAAIEKAQPENGTYSGAQQYLQRVKNTLNNVFTYDLDAMNKAYADSNPPTA